MSGFSERELVRRFPHISKSALRLNAEAVSGVPDAEPQRDPAKPLADVAEGEGEIVGRVRVKFTLCRVQPLDPESAAGSTKDLTDGLRHAGLLQDDNPYEITLETAQAKVAKYSQERTEIVITYA